MKHLFALALALAPLAAAPAHADIGPPRIDIVPAPKMPRSVTRWAKNALAAMKDGDMARAQKLCDKRGWSENLVGGSGTTLESLFAQGAKKRWHLVLADDVERSLP